MIHCHLQTLPSHSHPHESASAITLSVRSAGQPGRPVLMFLHGFPEGAFVWDGLLAHFSQPEHGGFRCVAPN
ncbi:MAG: alpha/beta fold hydrolase, partial [Burkholderiaceae bacterium]